nr:hypothetical protein Itr_chr04CG21900 [Ipomoea trifida]
MIAESTKCKSSGEAFGTTCFCFGFRGESEGEFPASPYAYVAESKLREENDGLLSSPEGDSLSGPGLEKWHSWYDSASGGELLPD